MSNPPPGVALRSKLAAYADLFERLLDCIFLVDPQTYTILEVNPACERILGIPQDKVVGRSIVQWVESSMRDDFEKALRVSIRRYYPRQFDSLWELPDNKKLTFEILACPLKLSDQTEVLQIIARDITFRREAEQKVQNLLKELQSANAKLEALSIIDEMTGMFNYRHFKAQMNLEHIRCLRTRDSYAVVFCDIDYFKVYNDKNGHPAGDALLREFAGIIKKACRSMDLPARYGGEEFVVFCPATDYEGGVVLAERIRKLVESTVFSGGENQPGGKVTVSIGVASYAIDGETPEDIVQAADKALYFSKKSGRNQVTSYQDPRVQTKDPKQAA